MKPADYLDEVLIPSMAQAGDPERAAGAKAYMKSQRSFYGLKKAQVDGFGRTFHAVYKDLPADAVIGLVDRLWQSDNFDEVTLGVVILRRYVKKLGVAHLDEPISRWFDGCEGWAHCDELASKVAGEIALQDRAGVPVVYAWRMRDVMWTRRAALLSHLPLIRAKVVPLDILLDTCECLLDEQEWFIRKAVGWTLRELARHYEQDAFAFVMKHKDRASTLTLREGSRNLPESLRRQVMG